MKRISLDKVIIGGFILSVLWLAICYVYYFYHRSVEFEEVAQLYDIEFRKRINEQPKYISCREDLFWELVERRDERYSSHAESDDIPYDYNLVESLAESMDFNKYDYIITYNRELGEIVYAPYLSDFIEVSDVKTPLIPLLKGRGSDNIYIYRIKKMDKEEYYDTFFYLNCC